MSIISAERMQCGADDAAVSQTRDFSWRRKMELKRGRFLTRGNKCYRIVSVDYARDEVKLENAQGVRFVTRFSKIPETYRVARERFEPEREVKAAEREHDIKRAVRRYMEEQK